MTPQPPAFGRRQAPASAPAPRADPLALSDSALAFKAELAESGGRTPDAFTDWRRAQTGRRGLAWVATFALVAPGLLCFAIRAPNAVSSAVEVSGLAASWWLRRERRRHLKAIADWRVEGEA